MSAFVDLHLHSTFSDGLLTPTELVAEAARAGLRAIALADHDNIDGIPEALEAGQRQGVEVVTGVELSVVWDDLQDLHLLGYGFDHTNRLLGEALAEFRAFRASRSVQVLEKVNARLTEQGRAPISVEDVTRRAGGTIGRPHIAQALLGAGYVRDMEQAFVDYLVPCNVPKRFFPIEEAIHLLHESGGCAVLAHPPFIRVDDKVLINLLETFKGFGLDGIEAYNTGTDNHGIDSYITMARRMDLIVTGGSDFHQLTPGGVRIGTGRGNLKIPYRCVEEIREASAVYC